MQYTLIIYKHNEISIFKSVQSYYRPDIETGYQGNKFLKVCNGIIWLRIWAR
jgi:hypothetical protein